MTNASRHPQPERDQDERRAELDRLAEERRKRLDADDDAALDPSAPDAPADPDVGDVPGDTRTAR
ncbi:MAG TPA: hypothetical protein VH459_02095 [Gaiellales bacterium]|jgi:hypothetical protein